MRSVGNLFRYCVILLVFVWAGCDQATEPEPMPSDPGIDEQLVDIITIGGQRGLDNFILPESNDLGAIPQDPLNPLTPEKVELGKLLFHETALASNPLKEEARGTYSCATCHHAGAGFQAGRKQALGEGGSGWGNNGEGRRKAANYANEEVDAQRIRTPSVLNGPYQEVTGWLGNFGTRGPNAGTDARWLPGTPEAINSLGYDGLETQAIAALSIHRMDSVQNTVLVTNAEYQDLWDRVFPGEEVSLEKVGLAIAAYERTLLSTKAPFQRWLKGETNAMTDAEKRGAVVFFGKAICEVCHTGPALNQMDFYALGMKDMEGPDVLGAPKDLSLGRGDFLADPAEDFKFKVPQLYNLVDSPFWGHGGTFRSMREIVEYYNDAIPDIDIPADKIPSRFRPLDLTEQEIDDLVVFLTVSLYDPDLDRYSVTELPSGNCTPANDLQARADLGC